MEQEFLSDLYPMFTDEERKIVEENLDLYLEIAWDIAQMAEKALSSD